MKGTGKKLYDQSESIGPTQRKIRKNGFTAIPFGKHLCPSSNTFLLRDYHGLHFTTNPGELRASCFSAKKTGSSHCKSLQAVIRPRTPENLAGCRNKHHPKAAKTIEIFNRNASEMLLAAKRRLPYHSYVDTPASQWCIACYPKVGTSFDKRSLIVVEPRSEGSVSINIFWVPSKKRCM